MRGKEKLDVPIKFLWNYAGNTIINQHSDINKTHEILQDESKCETIVVIDNFMTSSAKYADLLLPDLMTVEQEDIIPNDYAGNMGYLIFIQPATSAKFERKPIYWILSEVAKRLRRRRASTFYRGAHAGAVAAASVCQNGGERPGATWLRRPETDGHLQA
ncbi:anaerobic dimethyl sulfoxide reductase subunit A [Klebsiella aerogenes]|nr:anaerobic dimethyl sulfoxide reductase subunit A [Klebsiella aerogenes]